jgi:hypothetical protein
MERAKVSDVRVASRFLMSQEVPSEVAVDPIVLRILLLH